MDLSTLVWRTCLFIIGLVAVLLVLTVFQWTKERKKLSDNIHNTELQIIKDTSKEVHEIKTIVNRIDRRLLLEGCKLK